MARKNRYGEPWRLVSGYGEMYVHDVNGKHALSKNWTSNLEAKQRRAIACVNACAGLTNKELNRGVVAKKGKGDE